MFKENDYIICGSNGVCRVVSVGAPTGGIGNNNVDYYKLEAVYERGNTIYIPVNNDKILMRKVISKSEAQSLIDNIDEIDEITIGEERELEGKYREMLKNRDCNDLISIIKTSYQRGEERIADGKKRSAVDVKYLKLAEDYLYGELAVSLEGEIDNMKEMVLEKLSI